MREGRILSGGNGKGREGWEEHGKGVKERKRSRRKRL